MLRIAGECSETARTRRPIRGKRTSWYAQRSLLRQNQGFVLRLPMGAHGGYLLHAYIDKHVPGEVMKYCVVDDARR